MTQARLPAGRQLPTIGCDALAVPNNVAIGGKAENMGSV